MKRVYIYLIIGVFVVLAVIIYSVFKRLTYVQPQIAKIDLAGNSQIGLDLHEGDLFMYTSFNYQGDSSIIKIILNRKDDVIELNNRYFGGIINDTLSIVFDLQDTCYLIKYKNDTITELNKLPLFKDAKFSFGNFEPSIFNDDIGIYYLKDTSFHFLDLKKLSDDILLNSKDFGEDYANFTSFDIYSKKGVFCLKREVFNDSYYYDVYTYDFQNRKSSFIYKTPRTKHLTYEPIVKYINDTTVLTSFNVDDKSLIFKINLPKRKATEVYSLDDNIKVINITSNRYNKHYLTLLNEDIRDSLSVDNINVEKGIYGGVSIYSLTP
jgi:hypothetical protein